MYCVYGLVAMKRWGRLNDTKALMTILFGFHLSEIFWAINIILVFRIGPLFTLIFSNNFFEDSLKIGIEYIWVRFYCSCCFEYWCCCISILLTTKSKWKYWQSAASILTSCSEPSCHSIVDSCNPHRFRLHLFWELFWSFWFCSVFIVQLE